MIFWLILGVATIGACLGLGIDEVCPCRSCRRARRVRQARAAAEGRSLELGRRWLEIAGGRSGRGSQRC